MPNQRAPNMRHTSVTMSDELIRKIDEIATREERSRNKVIQMILERQVGKYLEQEDGLSGSKFSAANASPDPPSNPRHQPLQKNIKKAC